MFQAIVPWYKQWRFYILVVIMVLIIVVAVTVAVVLTVVITSNKSSPATIVYSTAMFPSSKPSWFPSVYPTLYPSKHPSLKPSIFPTPSPSVHPFRHPSYVPSSSFRPSLSPSISHAPSLSPTFIALKELYESTSGDGWINNQNWLSSTVSWCNWYGVSCKANTESITRISLVLNSLQGSIPSSISYLSTMEYLRSYIEGVRPADLYSGC